MMFMTDVIVYFDRMNQNGHVCMQIIWSITDVMNYTANNIVRF